jgi:hypothetical protein
VAGVTFGALAVVMGVGFSFLAPPPPAPRAQVYDAGGYDVIVARPEHVPADRVGREIALKSPLVVRVPPTMTEPDVLQALQQTGLSARASLPVQPRGVLAVLLPLGIASLGLMALAASLPSLLLRRPRARRALQALCVLAAAASIGVAVTRGALSWPGTDAWSRAPRLELR